MSNNLYRFFSLVCLCLWAQNAAAQSASSYSFNSIASTYTFLSGGTTISSIEEDDAVSGSIPIGFTFNYCGSNYTHLFASSNGWLSFNTSLTDYYAGNSFSNLHAIKPALFPLWDDLDGSTSYGGAASYKTSGTAPTREFVIEYKNWQWNYSATTGVISFQVKLFEGSNIIQFRYMRAPGLIKSGSASIGIGDQATTPTYISLADTTASPVLSSTTFTTSIKGKPSDGRVYQFSPPAPTCTTPAPGATIATPSTICLGDSIMLSLSTPPSGIGNSFQWQSSPDNLTYTDISGAGNSFYKGKATAALWYRCKVTCAVGPVSTMSTPVQVVFTHNIASVTNGLRCGTGSVSLAASTPTGTLKWYNTAMGGTPLGTGSPFNTPVIAASTNYYVAAESNSSFSGAIGSGGSSSSSSGTSPFSQYYESNHSQYLVLAGDLLAAGFGAGTLTKLSLNVSSKSSTKSFSGYTIKLASTASSTLSGLLSPSFTKVYGPASYSSVAGANLFTFTAPFTWDGSSNILVDICFDNDPTGLGSFWSDNDVVTATTKSYTAVYGLYEDDATLCGVTSGYPVSSSLLPVFTFTGNKICSSPRVVVTATVNMAPAFTLSGTQTVCNNGIATLKVSSPAANYTQYTWTPAAGLYTDAAATIPYSAGSSAATVYARTSTAGTITYTCNASNSTTLCDAVASVMVTTLPSLVKAVADPSYLCVSGTVVLTLIPTPAGFGAASYKWDASADNTSFTSIASASGSSYTTPTVSTTTYYRAQIRNSMGTLCLNSVSDTARVYNPSITGSSGASRCGPGPVTLSASASDGVISWYRTSSGGTLLGSGTTYTTPSLSSTTTYYAEVSATPDALFASGAGGATLGSSSGESGLTPFSQYYESQHTQHLYLASELRAGGLTAGKLQSLAFTVSEKNSTNAYTGYTVKIAPTNATSLSSGLLTPSFTTVYGPAAYTTVSGTNTFNFPSAFEWDGAANIVLDICFANDPDGMGGGLYSSNDVVSATTRSYTTTYGNYEDDEDLCSGSIGSSDNSTKQPVISFKKEGCRSARTPVVATINPLPIALVSPSPGPVNICRGGTATLTGDGMGSYQWRNTGGVIPGETGSTFTTGLAGEYRVVVTTAEGCKDSSDEISVIVNEKPSVSISPEDTLFICADSAQEYISVSSDRSLTYQWYNAGAPIPGATADRYTATGAGQYTLRVFLASCSDTSNETVLNVNPLPASDFTKTDSKGAICLADSLELTAIAIPAGASYQWLFNGSDIPGAGNQKYYAKSGGYYSVRIRDANNCRKESGARLIINTPMGIPDLSPKDIIFCEGNTIMLYANAGPYATAYSWTKDGSALPDTNGAITTGLSGSYDVMATDIYGCRATSEKVSVTVVPLPARPVIKHVASTLSVSGIYASYQWYLNGKKISGATKKTLALSFDGNYSVVVSNSFGCYNTSDTIMLTNLAVENIRQAMSIKLYPNPAQSIVYIDAPVPVTLLVRDQQGRRIAEVIHAQQIDMSPYADGLYLFTFSDEQGQILGTQHIVKKTE